MPSSNLCMNCFRIKGNYDVCPHCGFMEGTPPEQAFHLRPGEPVGGRYIIGTVLGFGGFGVTYKAWDATLSAIVAVKEFYPSGLVSRIPGERNVVVFSGEKAENYKAQLLRFLDEARNMAKFNNEPNIIGVYNFFEENNTAYIVMEYLDGVTLKEHMAQRGGSLSEEETVGFATPILEAIASIHSKKIVHRDISPDNIFVLKDGRVKVLDFGAARFSENPDGLTSTVVVKPGYAPPEQYRSKMKQGPWTDMYAAGATLYKMLTGVTPDESVDRMEKDELKPPSKLVRLANPALDTIILRAMALAPDLRFQKASDFIDAISGCREVELPEALQKKRKKRRVVSGVVSGVLALALLVAAALLASNSKTATYYIDIKARPETITVLVSESEAALFGTLVARYEQEFDGQKVQLVTAPDGGYEDMLAGLVAPGDAPTVQGNAPTVQGNAPTVFRAGASVERANTASLDALLSALSEEEYLFLPSYKEWVLSENQVPLTFVAPVCYINTTLVSVSDGLPPLHELISDSLDPSAAEAYGVSGRLSGDPVGAFFSDGSPYLLSTTKRLREVQANMPGYYAAVLPSGIAEIGASYFDNLWSVSADATENQQLAAQLFIGFLLGEYAQNAMCLQNGLGIPQNRKVFEQYIDINADLYYIVGLVGS